MSDKPEKALAKEPKGKAEAPATKSAAATATEEGDGKPTSRLSWVVGWVLVPAAVIGVLFGGGVVVGAHFHESWFTRMVVWCVELFV